MSFFGNLNRAAYVKASNTVRCGYKTSSCATKLVLHFMELENGRPLYVIMPNTLLGRRPARAVKRVVLLLPDGPNIASSSPRRTMPLTPLSTILLDFGSVEEQQLLPFVDKSMLYATSSNCSINLTILII